MAQDEDELSMLRRKCAFFEKVVNEVPANIYISDLEKGVVWCNRTNEETLGYTLDEILQLGGLEYLYKVVHPDDHTVPENSLVHYRNFEGAEYGGIFRARPKQETEYKWFIGWAKAFSRNADGSVREVLCADLDMSPRMNTEQQLIDALKENLRLKNRLLIQRLGKREREVLDLTCRGLSAREISDKLFLSVHTINTHRRNIQNKLGISNIAEMVALGKEAGLG
jgi:DNA-binding CsgD family transcriptional regulator